MTRKSKRVSRGPSPTSENRGKTGAKKLNGGVPRLARPHSSSPARAGILADGLEQQNSRRRAAPNSQLLFLVMPRGARTQKLLRTRWHDGR